jgi:hypothetical protein
MLRAIEQDVRLRVSAPLIRELLEVPARKFARDR